MVWGSEIRRNPIPDPDPGVEKIGIPDQYLQHCLKKGIFEVQFTFDYVGSYSQRSFQRKGERKFNYAVRVQVRTVRENLRQL
jgi:hypothetical protein